MEMLRPMTWIDEVGHQTKVHHAAMWRARRTARLASRRHDAPFTPYRCRVCGKWLVGGVLDAGEHGKKGRA